MMSLALFVLCAALVLIVEFLARIYESKSTADTAVSSLPNTDYKHSVLVRKILFTSLTLLLIFLLIAAIIEAPPWFCAPVLALFAVFRWSFARQLAVNARASQVARMIDALQRPEIKNAIFAFHFSAPDLSVPEHLNMWRKEFENLGVPWFAVLRERHHLKAFCTLGMPPALLIHSKTALHICLPKLVQAVFYANNGQKNRSLIAANPHVKHVQLLHGDSDKPPSFSPLSRNYDLVFVAGQMAIDRYTQNRVHIPHDKFRIVGRPQVRAIDPTQSVNGGARLRVLYMPTWRGLYEDNQLSSLDSAGRIIDAVLGSDMLCDLEFKPHPLSYADPKWQIFKRDIQVALDKKRANGNTGQFFSTDAEPFDLYNKADILITDISSVMIDFLYSNKPFLVILPKNFKTNSENRFPSLEASYHVQTNLKNLIDMIGLAAEGDPRASQREAIRAYAFGDIDRPPGEAFREACLALIDKNELGSRSLLKEEKTNEKR